MTSSAPGLSRPSEPRLLRYQDVPLILWGDSTSGEVCDWFYTTSEKIHFIMFSLRPGARWQHSDRFKPIWEPDVAFHVLQGSLTLHNPATGEVCVAHRGETLHFRRSTWHYGYNFTTFETRVLEAAAPIPADLSNEALNRMAQSVPPLEEVRKARYELMENWPWNMQKAREAETIKVLRPSDFLQIIQGEKAPVCVSLFVATDKLTMGQVTLLPGINTDVEAHGGDEVAVVTEGRINVRLPDTGGWFELSERDGFFTPQGTRHQYYNMSDKTATIVFGVAPRYY